MKIFTDEFKTYIKGLLFCSCRGHKIGKWLDTYWAYGHMGLPVRYCVKCGKIIKQKRLDWKKGIPGIIITKLK